jgi:transcriptional regulator with XRE-family HTH domain
MNRIRQLRKLMGYSQKELGGMVNKSLYTISKWELGQHDPSIEDIHLLSKIFEVTTDYIMGYTDVNDYRVELDGEKIPKTLRDAGLERVRLLKEYIDESGGLLPEVQKELLRLIAEAKTIQETDGRPQ